MIKRREGNMLQKRELPMPEENISDDEFKNNDDDDEEMENGETEDDSEAEDNSIDEEVDEESFENNGGMKRKLEEEDSTKKKQRKITDASLHKPPTVKELNQLRETENLFHSNLFRLQIKEMLKEVEVKAKYKSLFEKWIEEFKTFLGSIEDSKEYDLMDKKWLKKMKVKIPIAKYPQVSGVFKFSKPSSVTVMGSYTAGCCLGTDIKIDVRVEIPQACVDSRDYLNHKYHRKRALYVAFIAGKLKSSELVEEMSFTHGYGNSLTPLLKLKPKGNLGKRVSILVHPSLCVGTLKLARFSPERNNVRPNWYFEENENVEEHSLPHTPHYNTSVLKDLTMDMNEEYYNKSFESHPNLKDGIVLLKVWLKQRGLDQGFGCFSGYIMSLYVLYLVQSRRLNGSMSSYQIARNTWNNLAHSNWTTDGISLAQSLSQQSISKFHQYFEVVFMDITGFYNLCAEMKKETFLWVKHESDLAVKCLDNPNINSFQALFMSPMPFYRQFDHILRIQDFEKLVEEHSPRAKKLNYTGHTYPQALDLILQTLRRGLGPRVQKIGITTSVQQWSVNKSPPSTSEGITLGFELNPEFAFSVLEKGPGANLPEAFEFRDFWGKKSEVRRFQDGSISEAVVWSSGTTTLAQKRLILRQIVTYLLEEKFGLTSENVIYIAHQLDTLLEHKVLQPAGFEYGTGEEAALRVIGALDSLGKELRQLKDIPLEVSTVQGTSSVLRYCDVFPPLSDFLKVPKHKVDGKSDLFMENKSLVTAPRWISPIEAVMQLGMSARWPNDLSAVKRIKAAFYIKIAESLAKEFQLTAQAHSDCVQVLKNGFVFRLIVAHQHEIALLKESVTPEGVTRYRDTEESLALEKKIIHLPKLTSALHGLHQQHASYGPTCCLAKRWLSAQLLDPHHFPEMCIELLVASLYLQPEPYLPPNQPQLGFFRFLHLLAHTNWNTEPIILNLNSEMTREDILEIETWFHSSRTTLPSLFISTPYDRKNSMWTKEAPSLQILIRVAMLADEALRIVEGLLFLPSESDWKQVFRPPLDPYDVIIHLLPRLNPRRFQAVDFNTGDSKHKLQFYKYDEREKIPIVEFNPVYCYLAELRENYGDYALFFYDIYGGDKIAVLWKPSALIPKEFKVSHTNCHKPTEDGSQVELNVEAIVEDFYTIGMGLVSSVDVKSKSS